MLLILLLCAALAHAQELRVNTTEGVVVGTQATDGNYFNFYGLHYGGPTTGVNRFKAPTPPPPYPGEFHAISNDIFCAQPSENGIIGDENCLTLNVFTINANSSRPVVVWLEGNEYSNGGPPRSFARIVEQNVVVVRPNYRLSIFGFLCLGVAEAPGNAGLKDVIQALRWIRSNIAGFGGDPNNVILFGHGSGAAMVDLITMSPLATNLVHKAVVQSGSALAPWAVSYNPISSARNFGAKLGYAGKSNADLAKLLQNTTNTLLGAAFVNTELRNNTALFAPCIENRHLNANDTFLTGAPINLLRSGNYSHIPYITGYTNREGTLRAGQAAVNNWLQKMQTNFTEFLPVDLNFGNNLTTVERLIRTFYFNERIIDMSTIEDYLDYHGDTLVLVSVIRGARERAATSRSEVRLYEFTNRGTLNSDWLYQTIPLNGARHGIIINFLLGIDLRPIDEPVRISLTNRFTAFFTTGNPSPPGITTWLPVTRDIINFLYYSSTDTTEGVAINAEAMNANPHSQRMNFWDDLYAKYYIPPIPASSSRVLGVALLLVVCQLFVKLF
ncbi:venom carboxylesterase-6-like [Hyposmocoma kahamanoa]|uniref:venom carboxylesterase-6-like n=1 Tax=Hyposmocoma kahamanoa TaxID=1477025 RepID=UPI000E6D97E5|nr:venom carboxylesterase-6-like [Hyposmocoma kahamanoa]